MKKLTAGIFTILMGLVSVNAADAAVASKGYVDKQVREAKAYAASEVKSLAEGSVQANTAAIEAMDTAYKQADIALSARIDGLTGTGEQAAATKKELLDAKSEVLDEVKALENTKVQANIDAIAAIHSADNGILKHAKDYTDGKTGDVDFTSEGLNVVKGATNLTVAVDLLDAEASGNRSRIATLMGDEGVDGSVKKQIKDATTTITAAYTEADATQTETITAAYTEADATTLSAAKTYAKTYTDQKVAGLNLAEISRVPAACGTPGNYCTLTTNGTNFVWEVIARGDAADEEAPSDATGSSRLQVTVPAVTEPTVTQ